MKQSQINRLEMMQTTNSFLNSNTVIWRVIPIVTTYKNELTQIIQNIRSNTEDDEAARVFVGSSLHQLKIHIAEKMDILDDVLEAYADDTGNAELLTQASNSMSDYLRLQHDEFEAKTTHVIELLEKHVGSMSDYGLTQDQIEDVKLTFSSFQDKRNKPRSYQVDSVAETQNTSDLLTDGVGVLVKLDRVMKRFKRSNASFYLGYLAARTVIDN